jgi:hypothetical protein
VIPCWDVLIRAKAECGPLSVRPRSIGTITTLRPHDEGACPRTQKETSHWSLPIFAHQLVVRNRQRLPEALTAGTVVSCSASECRVENGGERYG